MSPGDIAHREMWHRLVAAIVTTTSLLVVYVIAGIWITLAVTAFTGFFFLASWTGFLFSPDRADDARWDGVDLEWNRAEQAARVIARAEVRRMAAEREALR